MPPEASARPLSGLPRPRALLPDVMASCHRIAALVRTIFAAGSLPGGTGNRRAWVTPGIERGLSLILIAAVIAALGITVFIIVTPREGEKFTEFYIRGPTGKAADYPTEFMSTTPQTVIIGIVNHESRDITYTVETFAVVSRFDSATNRSGVISATLLDRFSVTVPENRIVEQPYTFRIMDPNVNRLELLLFMKAPPDDIPMNRLIGAGYRNLHLWLRVH